MAFLDLKLVKTKKIDAKTVMKISENLVGDRHFIEFSTNDGHLRIEKSFPKTPLGLSQSKAFQKKFKSTNDILKYFGIAKEK